MAEHVFIVVFIEHMIDLLALLDRLADPLVYELVKDNSEAGSCKGERNVDIDELESVA